MPAHSRPLWWSVPHWRILSYHGVPDSHVGDFQRQLVAFREMGFLFVDLETGLNACRSGGFQGPTMTVTFDDGDLTVYKNVLPILESLGIKGFLYLIANYINGGRTYHGKDLLPAMTWDHVREWMRMGHGVGSHALTHPPMSLCGDMRLIQEYARSREVLQENLQVAIRHFAYPFGEHSRRTYRFLKDQRLYDSAATLDRGRMRAGQDFYKLRRDACDSRTPVASLVRIMRLADRWYWLSQPRRYLSRHCRQTHSNWKKMRLMGEWDALSEQGGT